MEFEELEDEFDQNMLQASMAFSLFLNQDIGQDMVSVLPKPTSIVLGFSAIVTAISI